MFEIAVCSYKTRKIVKWCDLLRLIKSIVLWKMYFLEAIVGLISKGKSIKIQVTWDNDLICLDMHNWLSEMICHHFSIIICLAWLDFNEEWCTSSTMVNRVTKIQAEVEYVWDVWKKTLGFEWYRYFSFNAVFWDSEKLC